MKTPSLIGAQLDKYYIQALIGEGGMGAVYLAFDPALERPVAIKVLDPLLKWDTASVQRFSREARTAAQLRHPNIVSIHDVGHEEGYHYFVMEYMQGQDLADLLDSGGLLSLDRVLSILQSLAAALDYAHSQNVMHRDIKPSNVMIESTGRVVLTDFGIARALSSKRITPDDHVLGTPHYMSPEQYAGRSVDTRTDLYSLGVLAYEMLTGRLPFHADNREALGYQIVHQRSPAPSTYRPNLPQETDRVLDKMLAKAPDSRYPSATAFLVALRQSLYGRLPRDGSGPRHEQTAPIGMARGAGPAGDGGLAVGLQHIVQHPLWIRWVVANALGWGFLGATCFVPDISHVLPLILGGMVLLVLHYVVLRDHFPDALLLSAFSAFSWSLAWALGVVAGMLDVFMGPEFLLFVGILGGSLGGLLIGVSRLTEALGGRLPGSAWIRLHVVGGGAALAVAWIVVLGLTGDLAAADDLAAGLAGAIGGAIGGTIMGAMSGAAIVRLPEQSSQAKAGGAQTRRHIPVAHLEPITPNNVTRIRPLYAQRKVPGLITGLAFSPDSRLLATASDGGGIYIWRVGDGVLLQQQQRLQASSTILFSQDGRSLIFASNDRDVLSWDIDSGSVRLISSFPYSISEIALSSDGKLAVASGASVLCFRWDRIGNVIHHLATLGTPTGTVVSMAFSPDGTKLAGGLRGPETVTDGYGCRHLSMWELPGEAPIWRMGSSGNDHYQVVFSPDGLVLACLCIDGLDIRRADSQLLYSWEGTAEWMGRFDPLEVIAFSPDSQILVAGRSSGLVHMWRLSDGRPLHSMGAPVNNNVLMMPSHSLAISPNGAVLATAVGELDHRGFRSRLDLWGVAGRV